MCSLSSEILTVAKYQNDLRLKLADEQYQEIDSPTVDLTLECSKMCGDITPDTSFSLTRYLRVPAQLVSAAVYVWNL